MNQPISNELLMRILQASPQQHERIAMMLDGREPVASPQSPLLLGMSASAKLLGVSRPTLWRMIRAGKLTKVEILPGSHRLRRADLEALAAGKAAV
jgi:excisionase family DNA binding protein